MRRIKAFERDSASAEHANIFEQNVLEARDERAGRGSLVGGLHHNWVLNLAHTDVAIGDVMHQSATPRIGLNTDAVIGAVDREIANLNGADPTLGLATNRHAVPGIKMIVGDGDVSRRTGIACLD